jgi:cysteine desulfurase
MIYFDNAATAPVNQKVMSFLLTNAAMYGNPSSSYSIGRESKLAISKARDSIALSLNCDASKIFFTSGGTEGNNIIIDSLCKSNKGKKKRIITSAIEHDSVLHTLEMKKREGFDVVILPVDKNGRVAAGDLEAAVNPDTFLVSIQLVNNEVGTIQDVATLCKVAHKCGAYFHTDAVQAVGHIAIDLQKLGVDGLTSSAHKFGGLKGTGFLYSALPLEPVLGGGGQERSIKPGTENVLGILSMQLALEDSLVGLDGKRKKVNSLRLGLARMLKEKIPAFHSNVDLNFDSSVGSFRFDGVSNEALINYLDIHGVCVSAGSACLGNSIEKSHVLRAIGLSDAEIDSTIRVSLSDKNTFDECAMFTDLVAQGIAAFRVR